MRALHTMTRGKDLLNFCIFNSGDRKVFFNRKEYFIFFTLEVQVTTKWRYKPVQISLNES